MNGTTLNMARCMLKFRSMAKELWAKIVSCASYLSNRSPTSDVKDQTPQETLTRRKPSVKHLQVFGRIGYAHVP